MSVQILNSCIRKSLKYEGIIFDLDGVLLDTEKLYARFWKEAANCLGYPMTHEQALGMRSLNRDAGQAQLEAYFGPGISHAVVRQKRIELMEAYVSEHGVELMPDVDAILSTLKAKEIPMAIATSSPMERVNRYFGKTGLLTFFDVVITGYDVQKGKPAPDIYLRASETLGISPENCIAVEDSPAGLRSAHDAGCIPIFIPDQDGLNASVAKFAYAKIDRLLDLLDVWEEFA